MSRRRLVDAIDKENRRSIADSSSVFSFPSLFLGLVSGRSLFSCSRALLARFCPPAVATAATRGYRQPYAGRIDRLSPAAIVASLLHYDSVSLAFSRPPSLSTAAITMSAPSGPGDYPPVAPGIPIVSLSTIPAHARRRRHDSSRRRYRRPCCCCCCSSRCPAASRADYRTSSL